MIAAPSFKYNRIRPGRDYHHSLGARRGRIGYAERLNPAALQPLIYPPKSPSVLELGSPS